ncbi:hypothetical protein GCM10010503_37570 [Streptomyces lucensis JCM 4490]|uniref:Uncharacterized protein n=1 Tax=Streptomyces lucensis JCM 4490 TaxID=1306176 RepID=A0A918MR88_9ACTN|nr:hypothetical protein [Streptomyces lucensis]GGW56831.1 hypothetical protein GCM10010503_37570 [Streptomyces lucensis JCM 4490]
MLKLDAPMDGPSGFRTVISNDDYPESQYGYTGPGWSWMWVNSPFALSFVEGQFTRRVFKQYQTSHRDLRSFASESLAPNDPHWSKACAAALRDTTAQEFILVCSIWAFASFEVRSGRSAEAGTAFYNGWVAAMNADPQATYALQRSEKPTVIVMS